MPIYLWVLCGVAWWVVGVGIITTLLLVMTKQIILGNILPLAFFGLLGPLVMVSIAGAFLYFACEPLILRIQQQAWYNIIIWRAITWKLPHVPPKTSNPSQVVGGLKASHGRTEAK